MSPTNQPPAVTGTLLNEELADLLTASRNGSLQNLDKKFDALAIKIEAIYDASERTATSMNILVTLMAAQVAWGLQDRLTGNWTVGNSEWLREFYESVVRGQPMLWFIIAVLLWTMFAIGLKKWADDINAQKKARVSADVAAALSINTEGASEL